MSERACAFAPASIGNVAVGFDMLGLALEGAGDHVTAARTDGSRVTVADVLDFEGNPHPHLSAEADRNTASIAAEAFWDAHGDRGALTISVAKGVPLQSGMGSSAASAVAAVVAANALLDAPLPVPALLPYAIEGERFASKGLHADNVAPSLFGGLVLCPQVLLPDVVQLPVPAGVSTVLVHPDLRVNTAQARRVLATSISMKQWIEQQGLLAGFIAACANGDVEGVARTLKDVIIEPQRAVNVPCFDAVRAAADEAGALGCSLSGSGPSLFALCRDADAECVADAMSAACLAKNIDCQSWISPMTAPGAHVEELL